MPRVETLKAAKDYPEQGILKGETYYKWAFRFGGVHKSKTYPKRSQLTQSEFLSAMFDIEDDRLSCEGCETVNDLVTLSEEVVSELETLRDDVQDKIDNLPDSLRDSSMLNDRLSSVEDMIQEVEGIDFEEDDYDNLEERKFEMRKKEDGTEEKVFTETLDQYRERMTDIISDCNLDEDDEKEDANKFWEEVEEARKAKRDEMFETKKEELGGITYGGE